MTVKPESRMTLAQDFTSSSTCCLNWAWVKVEDSAAFCASTPLKRGCCIAFMASSCSRAVIASGVTRCSA